MPKPLILSSPRKTRSKSSAINESRPTALSVLQRKRKGVLSSPKIVNKKRNIEIVSNISKQKNTRQMAEGEEIQRNIDEEWRRITEERQRLVEERIELERMRNSLRINPLPQQQEIDRNQPQIQPANDNNATNGELVNGLVTHFQNLQINLNLPKFNEDHNPLEYLEEVERYFKLKNIRNEHKLALIENIIDGRARTWYEAIKDSIDTFEAFKQSFKEEFYSIPERVRFKNNWSFRKYKSGDGSMHTYFYKQIKETRYFEPPLTPYEINFTIVQQFPPRVRSSLATINYNDSNRIAQALSQLDLAQENFIRQKESRTQFKSQPHSINSMQCSQTHQQNQKKVNHPYHNPNGYSKRNTNTNYYRNSNEQQIQNCQHNNPQTLNVNSFQNRNNTSSAPCLPDFRFPPPDFQP